MKLFLIENESSLNAVHIPEVIKYFSIMQSVLILYFHDVPALKMLEGKQNGNDQSHFIQVLCHKVWIQRVLFKICPQTNIHAILADNQQLYLHLNIHAGDGDYLQFR